MITASKKDELLNLLVGGRMNQYLDIWQLSSDMGIEADELDAMLEQFDKMGLCTVSRCLGGRVNVSLHAEAHDMVLRGGFVAQEELLKQSIEKLLLELESLKHQNLANAERISSLIANIGAALGMMFNL